MTEGRFPPNTCRLRNTGLLFLRDAQEELGAFGQFAIQAALALNFPQAMPPP